MKALNRRMLFQDSRDARLARPNSMSGCCTGACGLHGPDRAGRGRIRRQPRFRRGFIREPSVAVEIESYRPFFILGEVAAPGQYPYVPNMTVESAVAIAGGFSPRARRDRVTLTHTDASGPARFVVLSGTPLSPGDTVLVGERWF
jgi:protein involved in polysaccharide export with SLBB domain